METLTSKRKAKQAYRHLRRKLWPVQISFAVHAICFLLFLLMFISSLTLMKNPPESYDAPSLFMAFVTSLMLLLFTAALTFMWAFPFFKGSTAFRVLYVIHMTLEALLFIQSPIKALSSLGISITSIVLFVWGLFDIFNIIYVFRSNHAQQFLQVAGHIENGWWDGEDDE